jgi:hypothetical protein
MINIRAPNRFRDVNVQQVVRLERHRHGRAALNAINLDKVKHRTHNLYQQETA